MSITGCHHAPQFVDEGVGQVEALPVNSFQQQWTAQLPTEHGAITRLFARENLVFGYTADGTSYVLDRPSGRILHEETVRHGSEALHPPVVLKDRICYPTNTSVEIYDKKGDLVHSKDLGYSIRSDAVGSRNYVYFGADYLGGGRLISVDVNNEYLDHRWELMMPGALISAAPALLGDIVYVASEAGKVAAVAYDTREPVWTVPANGVFRTYDSVVADLAADDSGVYVASTDTKLVCLNRNNGKVKWQYPAATALRDTPVLTKDFVFQIVPTVGLVALDKNTGAYNRVPRWIAPDIIKILAEDEKFVYGLREDKVIMALEKSAGKVIFTSRRRDLSVFASNVRDGSIYTVTTGNRVIALLPVLKPGLVGEVAVGPMKPDAVAVAVARYAY